MKRRLPVASPSSSSAAVLQRFPSPGRSLSGNRAEQDFFALDSRAEQNFFGPISDYRAKQRAPKKVYELKVFIWAPIQLQIDFSIENGIEIEIGIEVIFQE